MRKSFLPQVLSASAIGFLGGIAAISLAILPAHAQSRAGVIDLNYVKLCRSESDLRSLARYLRDQKTFSVTPDGVNNWRANGLGVPKALDFGYVEITADAVIKVNGKQTRIKNIRGILPALENMNDGDVINLLVALLRVRGSEKCFNARSNRRGELFAIGDRNFDFVLENVRILRRQAPTTPYDQGDIQITSY